jgi:hypothetical protein
LQEQLLAGVLDAAHVGNWQRGRGKGKRPKPVPRPGVPGYQREQLGTVMSLAEAREKQRRWAEGRSGKVDRPSKALTK